jgi:hypothetical protein
MSSNYGISALDSWLGLENGRSSVTASTDPPNTLKDIPVKQVEGFDLGYRVTGSKVVFLKREKYIVNKYKENDFSLCNPVTGGSAGRIVPPNEVLASAELARQRNRRDRDLIALMYPSNVIEWTWIEHADGTWTAHHSIIFEEAV